MLLCEQKPEQQQKEDSKIQTMEITFLRPVLNKAKDRIRNHMERKSTEVRTTQK